MNTELSKSKNNTMFEICLKVLQQRKRKGGIGKAKVAKFSCLTRWSICGIHYTVFISKYSFQNMLEIFHNKFVSRLQNYAPIIIPVCVCI